MKTLDLDIHASRFRIKVIGDILADLNMSDVEVYNNRGFISMRMTDSQYTYFVLKNPDFEKTIGSKLTLSLLLHVLD